jgi:hypothetical protein
VPDVLLIEVIVVDGEANVKMRWKDKLGVGKREQPIFNRRTECWWGTFIFKFVCAGLTTSKLICELPGLTSLL